MEKCPPKFYDLKIYGKTHVRQEGAHALLPRDHLKSIPERHVPLLGFCNHRFARIVRDLTINLGAVLRFQYIFIINLVYLTATFTRRH